MGRGEGRLQYGAASKNTTGGQTGGNIHELVALILDSAADATIDHDRAVAEAQECVGVLDGYAQAQENIADPQIIVERRQFLEKMFSLENAAPAQQSGVGSGGKNGNNIKNPDLHKAIIARL